MTGPTRRALLVVAHPDDETFGTGSVIASLAAAGVEVVVCCATRGEMGEAHGVPEGADLGAVREAELRAAGAILGVADFVLLGYLDSGMTGDLAEGSLVGAPLEEVVGRVRAVVEDVDPELVITLDPVNSDGHRDHVRIGEATTEACRDRAGTRALLLDRQPRDVADLVRRAGPGATGRRAAGPRPGPVGRRPAGRRHHDGARRQCLPRRARARRRRAQQPAVADGGHARAPGRGLPQHRPAGAGAAAVAGWRAGALPALSEASRSGSAMKSTSRSAKRSGSSR